MKQAIAAIFVLAALVAAPDAFAEDKQGQQEGAAASREHSQTPWLADGEVRKVDKDAQKITVRHGPLPELDMPKPMTMVYRVEDAAILDKAKAGDKIKFRAENINGVFTLTAVEAVR